MKRVKSIIVILMLLVSVFGSNIFAQERLLANAKVVVHFEAGIVATCTSNSRGEITFSVPAQIVLPIQGQFGFEIFPPAILREDPIIVFADFNLNARSKNAKFTYVLKYTPPVGANKGVFAVSGRNTA